jgi:hypothetical protein
MQMSNITSDDYREKYVKIFGNHTRPQTGSWIRHPDTGEMVPKSEYTPTLRGSSCPSILKGIKEFVSPVDGSTISDRGQLRRHNEKHGVANPGEYGANDGAKYFERKAGERQIALAGDSPKAKRERVDTIKQAMHQHGM